ncbi:hypothetical protein [Dactylosporangium sp. CA-139066]|uniref:hypothetical protein n=1 Tax=Dactylosporangium sp. CA-139066 TaxID=3239930 RepID=UPI003D8AA738
MRVRDAVVVAEQGFSRIEPGGAGDEVVSIGAMVANNNRMLAAARTTVKFELIGPHGAVWQETLEIPIIEPRQRMPAGLEATLPVTAAAGISRLSVTVLTTHWLMHDRASPFARQNFRQTLAPQSAIFAHVVSGPPQGCTGLVGIRGVVLFRDARQVLVGGTSVRTADQRLCEGGEGDVLIGKMPPAVELGGSEYSTYCDYPSSS